jgi:transcriptional regulator with GAF, ATPase, and Fis domain
MREPVAGGPVGSASEAAQLVPPSPAAREDQSMSLVEMERQHIIAVLRRTQGVIEGPHGAARLLNLKPSTARFRIRKLGIRRSDFITN